MGVSFCRRGRATAALAERFFCVARSCGSLEPIRQLYPSISPQMYSDFSGSEYGVSVV